MGTAPWFSFILTKGDKSSNMLFALLKSPFKIGSTITEIDLLVEE